MSTMPPQADALARLIAAKPELVRGICVFNQNPADYLDESRRGEFFDQRMDAALWQCPRARRQLSRHILQRMGAAPCLEANRPEWPLALLQRPRLDRLARHIAAALVGARVRRSISRAEVLKWRDWLTPEAHEFALTRAGLLPLAADAGTLRTDHVTALEVGHSWIAAASRRWPEAIASRFILKLPAGGLREADTVDAAFAARLVSSVLSIVEARWCSSFASTRG